MTGFNQPEQIEKLWSDVLDDLQLTTTRATFETWLMKTQALGFESEKLVIGVPSIYAIEWLDNRLRKQIGRALKQHGYPGLFRFMVAGEFGDAVEALREVSSEEAAATAPGAALSEAMIELVEFDPARRGWMQLPAYAVQFWQPYLDDGPFNLWLTLRSYGQQGGEWPSLQTLADVVARGNRQLLTGRPDRERDGWLAVLESERLLWFRRRGNRYVFRVLDNLPLLTPTQVQRLPMGRRIAHDRFLIQAKLDKQEWEQLTLSSLVKEED